MPIIIPETPAEGGALAEYLSGFEAEIGWVNDVSVLGQDLLAALEDRNDPATWVAFAGKSLKTVWGALPEDVRDEARASLQFLIEEGLDGIPYWAGDAAVAAASDIATAVPIIGAIVEIVVTSIQMIIDAHKDISAQRDLASETWSYIARYNTVRENDANGMVFKQARVENYLKYDSNKWYLRPSFSRSSGAADLMFVNSSGKVDKGWCGQGARMNCPFSAFFEEDECSFFDKNPKACERHLGVSSLFYPFWSSAYPDQDVIGYQEGFVSPDQLMIEQQFALLTSPSVNLRVDVNRLLAIRDRFVAYFFNQAKQYAPQGHAFGLLKIDDQHRATGTPVAERLTVDLREEEKYVPYQDRVDKFYLDKYGLIHPYDSTGADLSQWGVRAKRGPDTPQYASISAAQYNTVVSATLAFMAARTSFLRDGLLMKALLHDFDGQVFDQGVRSAMQYSAEVGDFLPMPESYLPARMPKNGPAMGLPGMIADLPRPPGRAPKPGGSRRGGGGGAAVIAAAAVVAFLASKK